MGIGRSLTDLRQLLVHEETPKGARNESKDSLGSSRPCLYHKGERKRPSYACQGMGAGGDESPGGPSHRGLGDKIPKPSIDDVVLSFQEVQDLRGRGFLHIG